MDEQEFAEIVKERYKRDPNGRLPRQLQEYIRNGDFSIRVAVEGETDLSWVESNLGTAFGSKVDYGRTYNALTNDNMDENELQETVRDRVLRMPRQIDFVEKEDGSVSRVYTGVVAVVKQNGYAIHPDPEKAIPV